MKPTFRTLACAIGALALFALSACTSTGVVAKWSSIDPVTWQLEQLLVAGGTDDPQIRATFEETLSAELARKGVKAVQSVALVPDAAGTDTRVLLDEARNRGIHFVMVSRVVEIGEKDIRVPEYHPVLYAYESGGNPYGFAGKFMQYKSIQQKFVSVKTELLDARTENVIWSAVSETTSADAALSAKRVIDSVCAAVSEELRPSDARG